VRASPQNDLTYAAQLAVVKDARAVQVGGSSPALAGIITGSAQRREPTWPPFSGLWGPARNRPR
jgi:hypothetical protein